MDRDQPENPYPWIVDLEGTLNSPEGTKALESYLIHCDSLPLLEFIWACDGMKNLVEETPSKADDLVSCIYKNYIISGCIPILSNQVVMSIAKQFEAHFEQPEPSDMSPASKKVRPEPLDLSLFDDAKAEVESHLQTQIFPQFQKAVQNGEVCISTGAESATGADKVKNGYQAGASISSASSRIASHPEVFARTLCEKLESLMKTRESKPPP